MTTVYTRQQIEQVIQPRQVIAAMERAFVAYSMGEAVIPPVGALEFADPPGDCHIKYGYAKSSPYYVVKIASGFPDNPKLRLPSGNGRAHGRNRHIYRGRPSLRRRASGARAWSKHRSACA